MDPSRRASPGDPALPFSAELRNRTLAAIEYVEHLKRGDTPDLVRLRRDYGIVTLKNESGDDRGRFEVMGLQEPLYTPGDNSVEFRNRTPLRGILPSYPEHQSPRFGVLLAPCPDLKIVKACISGLVPVRLAVTHEDDQYCGIEAGEYTHLLTGGGEVPIIWKDESSEEDENGNRWGIVELGCGGTHPVEFELLEELVQWSGDVVRAARKTWDPSADGGKGGLIADCENVIYVGDYNKEGHNADVGGFGKCYMRQRVNSPKWVGVIYDLCCPGDEKGVCLS